MSEHNNNHQERLHGETVETRDEQKLTEVRSGLVAYQRERQGLPVKPIIIEGETIPPVSAVGTVDQTSVSNAKQAEGITPKNSPLHLTEVRIQKSIASALGDKRALQELKKAA